MALPLPPGLTHAEVAFLAEMELVTVVPRQRLESIDLLGGRTPPLRPPHRADLPLWLALLLKKQRRANILPPPWLHPVSLADIIHRETKKHPNEFSDPPPPPARADPLRPGQARRQGGRTSTSDTHDAAAAAAAAPTRREGSGSGSRSAGGDETILSPPFQPSCTASAPAGYLPYHWLEVAEALLAHAGDDVAAATVTTNTAATTLAPSTAASSAPSGAAEVRSLLRDLAEVRAAKLRSSTANLEGFGGGLVSLRGVGAMELAETRGFVLGVVDGVRRIGASAEAARREEEEEEMERERETEEEAGEAGRGARAGMSLGAGGSGAGYDGDSDEEMGI